MIYLKKCHNGKSLLAEYKFLGGRITVYLRHNKPCIDECGVLYISCYIKPTGSNEDMDFGRHEFTSYSDFIEFRKNFENEFNLVAI